MTRHYLDLGNASDWLKRSSRAYQPIRSTTKIWVVTRHQYGISALVTQTSFSEGSSGDLVRRRLFSQANFNENSNISFVISVTSLKVACFI